MEAQLPESIQAVEKENIAALLTAVLNRYRELYPQWEISLVSIDKSTDRAEQIDRVIAILEKMKGQV